MKRNARILIPFITSLFVMLSLQQTAHAISLPSDVTNHWARAHIEYCIENQYMTGVGNNKFNPDGHVTRAQTIQVLYNLAGRPSQTQDSPFTDIQTHWAKIPIQWAYAQNITSGVSSTKFSPNTPVTRGQAVVMFHNYAKPDPVETSVLNKFTDHDDISSWSEQAMAWAISAKIITGSDNKLRPKNILTRAELAVIIHNYTNQNETPSPPTDEDIESIIKNTNTADFKKYADCCDSTEFERQVMYLITAVKYEHLSPETDWKDSHVINPLWHDPRFVAKITCYELAHSNTNTTPRIQNNPNPKDYFQSIYEPRNLTTADYVSSYWYKFIHLSPNTTPQQAANKLLSDPDTVQYIQKEPMNFYGIYFDLESGWLCIAHGMARAGH